MRLSSSLCATLVLGLSLCFTAAGCSETDGDDDDRPGDGNGPRGDGGSGDTDGDGGGGDGGGGGGGGGAGGGGEDPNADDDGDGLTNAQEENLGTDPTRADTDGDGVDDGQEVADGTNPNYAYSHAYAGGYNVGFCDEEPVATGPTSSDSYGYPTYRKNDVAENFTLVDQHGEQVDLYSFCGQYVMIAFGASWCGPCQTLAAEVQQIQDRYEGDGFQAIEVLIEDVSGQAPNQADLTSWANQARLETVPVLGDGGYDVWPDYEVDYGIPTIVHLGPDMTVLSVDQYIDDPGQFIP